MSENQPEVTEDDLKALDESVPTENPYHDSEFDGEQDRDDFEPEVPSNLIENENSGTVEPGEIS